MSLFFWCLLDEFFIYSYYSRVPPSDLFSTNRRAKVRNGKAFMNRFVTQIPNPSSITEVCFSVQPGFSIPECGSIYRETA